MKLAFFDNYKLGVVVGDKIVDWDYALWSNTHSMRPGGAGSLGPRV